MALPVKMVKKYEDNIIYSEYVVYQNMVKCVKPNNVKTVFSETYDSLIVHKSTIHLINSFSCRWYYAYKERNSLCVNTY